MQPWEEIRAFASPPQSWAEFAGRAGYALVCGEAALDGIVTLMN